MYPAVITRLFSPRREVPGLFPPRREVPGLYIPRVVYRAIYTQGGIPAYTPGRHTSLHHGVQPCYQASRCGRRVSTMCRFLLVINGCSVLYLSLDFSQLWDKTGEYLRNTSLCKGFLQQEIIFLSDSECHNPSGRGQKTAVDYTPLFYTLIFAPDPPCFSGVLHKKGVKVCKSV